MYFLNNKTAQIDDLLARAAEKLQLNKARKEKIESSYAAIQNLLETDKEFFDKIDFEIYPQGSVRIGTTVKPIKDNEFDLDIVLHIKNSRYQDIDPMNVYNQLKRVLHSDDRYRDKVELKNRCIRIDYAGDFHMDVLPGCQVENQNSDKIVIPDRELKSWLTSNPKGYGKWFIAKSDSVRQTLLEKAFSMEDLPSDEYATKKPLQRAVQIIKRYRDLFFEKDTTYATPSIVLTTLAGQLYQNQDSIFETIDSIVSQLKNSTNSSRNTRIKVVNPVNPEEDFTDKWEREPTYYTEFIKFVEALYHNWQNLKKENGLIEEGNILKGIIGEKLYSDSVKDQTLLTEDFRRKGKLFTTASAGTIGSSKVAEKQVQKNTFFGE